jgi:DNA polymerase-4
MGRVIFHIDMNSFFASCEIAENPELKGQKVAVAHVSLDKKGMVLAATYEAKAYGIKTTMLVYEALRLCPDLIFVEPNHELYQEYSRKFFKQSKN